MVQFFLKNHLFLLKFLSFPVWFWKHTTLMHSLLQGFLMRYFRVSKSDFKKYQTTGTLKLGSSPYIPLFSIFGGSYSFSNYIQSRIKCRISYNCIKQYKHIIPIQAHVGTPWDQKWQSNMYIRCNTNTNKHTKNYFLVLVKRIGQNSKEV